VGTRIGRNRDPVLPLPPMRLTHFRLMGQEGENPIAGVFVIDRLRDHHGMLMFLDIHAVAGKSKFTY
jgi:hypothetical protein